MASSPDYVGRVLTRLRCARRPATEPGQDPAYGRYAVWLSTGVSTAELPVEASFEGVRKGRHHPGMPSPNEPNLWRGDAKDFWKQSLTMLIRFTERTQIATSRAVSVNPFPERTEFNKGE